MKKLATAMIILALACKKDKKDWYYDCHNGDYYPSSKYSESDMKTVEQQCGCKCDLTCP